MVGTRHRVAKRRHDGSSMSGNRRMDYSTDSSPVRGSLHPRKPSPSKPRSSLNGPSQQLLGGRGVLRNSPNQTRTENPGRPPTGSFRNGARRETNGIIQAKGMPKAAERSPSRHVAQATPQSHRPPANPATAGQSEYRHSSSVKLSGAPQPPHSTVE